MSEHEHQHTAPTVPLPPPVTTEKVAPDLSKVKPHVVERNGVKLTLTPFAGKRGNWDGIVYQAPQINVEDGKLIEQDETFLNGLRFISKEKVQTILNIFCKRFAQDAHLDAIPDTGEQKGVFQVDKFLRSIQDFSVAQLRISELRELLDEAIATYTSAQTQFVTDMIAARTDEERKAIGEKFTKLGAIMTQRKAEYDERVNKKSKEVETDTVRPE